MRYDLENKELVAKDRKQEIETVVIIREECEVCNGTGLNQMEGRTIDCYECQGYGMIQVSKKKTIERID